MGWGGPGKLIDSARAERAPDPSHLLTFAVVTRSVPKHTKHVLVPQHKATFKVRLLSLLSILLFATL